jgi:uncharacterized membrane protein YoaK (UPF0700 family)
VTGGSDEATRGPLAVAALLAAIAGYVDAIGFDRVFDVFPANQSGNAVLLGIGLGEGSGSEAWRPAVAIVGFALGVALAIRLGRTVIDRRAAALLAVEVVLLVPVLVVVLTDDHPAAIGGAGSIALILATSCAMGLQTEVIRRVAGVAVATTYQSGAIARIAELAGGADPGRDRAPTRAVGLAVLVVVLAAYVGGAAGGAAAGDRPAAMLVPVALLVGLIGVAVRRPGWDDRAR